MGCHAPLQGIFRTQGLNMHLLHCTSPALTGSASATWEAHGHGQKKKKKIIQGIKTHHPVFQGLSPMEPAHTPHCSVCFGLGCSHFLRRTTFYEMCISLNKPGFTLLWFFLSCAKPGAHSWQPVPETSLRPGTRPFSCSPLFLQQHH